MSQVELDYDPNGQKRKKNNGSFSNHHKIELGVEDKLVGVEGNDVGHLMTCSG